MACEFLALFEIGYGLLTSNKTLTTSGILTLLVCNECCKRKKCINSQQIKESTSNQNSQLSESNGFGGIIV